MVVFVLFLFSNRCILFEEIVEGILLYRLPAKHVMNAPSKSISGDLSYETLWLLLNSSGSSEGGNGAAGDYLLNGTGSTHPHHPHVQRGGLVSSFRLWIYD